MSARLGIRRRNALVALAFISLASIGACHKSATDPYDPDQSQLRPAQLVSARSAAAGTLAGTVHSGWNLAQNKKAASMVGSAIDAIGKALAEAARK